MNYELFIERAAQRTLQRIPQLDQARIVNAVRSLSGEPRPPGTKKLRGRDGWRIRSGDYRVIYEIDDAQHRILVLAIGHRRDISR